jgi:hypothetical protein
MPLQKLRRQFEERRVSLIETLKKSKETLELSKQHQLYGAIKEIENFVKAIDFYREEQLKGADFELRGVEPKRRPGHAKERTKAFFASVGTALKEGIARPARSVVHAAKRKVHLVKEVAREVKARSKEKKE